MPPRAAAAAQDPLHDGGALATGGNEPPSAADVGLAPVNGGRRPSATGGSADDTRDESAARVVEEEAEEEEEEEEQYDDADDAAAAELWDDRAAGRAGAADARVLEAEALKAIDEEYDEAAEIFAMRRDELREELRLHGLPITGTKVRSAHASAGARGVAPRRTDRRPASRRAQEVLRARLLRYIVDGLDEDDDDDDDDDDDECAESS